MAVAKLYKVTLYFLNSLFLYFVIGIVACNISFPVIGMIFGAPSVLIAALTLSFARTLEMYILDNYVIDLKDYLRAFIYFIIATIIVIIFIASLIAIYMTFGGV